MKKTISEDHDLVPNLTASPTPEISSMSWCKFKNHPTLNVDEKTYGLDLILVLQDMTAKFVTKEN